MASISEATGIALLGSAFPPAVSDQRQLVCFETGKAIMNLIENNIRPRDNLTFEALENGIAITNAMGGSTNAVLHLLAIGREAGIKLDLKDFEIVRKRTPQYS